MDRAISRFGIRLRHQRRETETSSSQRYVLQNVDGHLMSSYGQRTDPFSGEGAYHTGVDISSPLGARVLATADGIVMFADRDGGYGRLVVVDHGNGFETYYAHRSRFDVMAWRVSRHREPVGAM